MSELAINAASESKAHFGVVKVRGGIYKLGRTCHEVCVGPKATDALLNDRSEKELAFRELVGVHLIALRNAELEITAETDPAPQLIVGPEGISPKPDVVIRRLNAAAGGENFNPPFAPRCSRGTLRRGRDATPKQNDHRQKVPKRTVHILLSSLRIRFFDSGWTGKSPAPK